METKFCSAKRVSARELAEFMGVSTRTLTRLDEKGLLVAYRNNKGRRVYTTEHVEKALEIMHSSARRKTNVTFYKNGVTSIYGRINIPRRWLEKIGVTRDDSTACIRFDGENIIITKEGEAEQEDDRVYFDVENNG